jgi:ribosomal protein L37E
MNALRCERCGTATPFNPEATYPRRCASCGCVVAVASMPSTRAVQVTLATDKAG